MKRAAWRVRRSGPRERTNIFLREFSRCCRVILVIAATWASAPLTAVAAEDGYGPFGPEARRMREQLWVLPSGDPDTALRATVFRPDDDAGAPPGGQRRPLVVINHGTSELTRESVSMPVYYWLSRWFVDRGYVVVLPQRRGHGATGGPLAESVGTCADPDYYHSGLVAADDIGAVVDYMTRQPFVAPRQTIVVGISTGGWGSLALASRGSAEIRAVINFAGGRGGHAGGHENAVCAASRLVETAAMYGRTARIPTLWLYSANDSYFGPELARAMAKAWTTAGGNAELDLLPPYRNDGHQIADDQGGWQLWGSAVDHFLGTSMGSPQVVENEARGTAVAVTPAATPAPTKVSEAPVVPTGAQTATMVNH